MTYCDNECGYRHCAVCVQHLDAGEFTTCWACVGKARRDLLAIMELVALLPEHALNGATNGHLVASDPIPGGDAVVMLGRGSEGLSDDATTNPGDPEPPAWVLGWWEEVWRENLGLDSKLPVWRRRPEQTLATAGVFLGEHLDWAANYHRGFRRFAHDLGATRHQLEALLRAGDAPMEGVSCFECGATLERVYRAPRGCSCPPKAEVHVSAHFLWEKIHASHDQGGLSDPTPDAGWSCSRCKREYSPGEYRLAVTTAYDAAAEWRTQSDASRLTDCPRGTIQGWASRGQIRRRKDSLGRVTYSVVDIRTKMAENLPEDVA